MNFEPDENNTVDSHPPPSLYASSTRSLLLSTDILPRGVNCSRCAYELHGLSRDSACPECGTPVEHSLQSDALIFASPTHLRRLRLGAELVTWCAFTWFLCIFTGIIDFWVMWVLQTLVAAGMCRGVWLLTEPDLDGQNLIGDIKRNLVTRWVFIGSYAVYTLAMVFEAVSMGATGSTPLIVAFLLMAIGWTLLIDRVVRIYQRGRVRRLAQWTHAAKVMLIFCIAFAIVFWALFFVIGYLPTPAIIAIGFLLGVPQLVLAISISGTLIASFIVLVELGSWINRARLRSESIRAGIGTDHPIPI